MGHSLETVMGLLGIEWVGVTLPELSLLPIALVGGGLFFFSLVAAWGLYRRKAFFYWLTVGVILFGFLILVFMAVSADKLPVLALLASGGCLLLTICFAFMAYDEYAWERHRLDASVDSDVDGPSALFGRGRVYAQYGMWGKAAAHWSRAVALNPGHADYRLALASAYLNLVQPDRALEHLEAVQRLEPDNTRAQELLEDFTH
jgi:tetratricopeptide (TPR) repeat protein